MITLILGMGGPFVRGSFGGGLLFEPVTGFFQQGADFGFPDIVAEHFGHKEPELVFHLAPQAQWQGFAAIVDQAAKTACVIAAKARHKNLRFLSQRRVFACIIKFGVLVDHTHQTAWEQAFVYMPQLVDHKAVQHKILVLATKMERTVFQAYACP